MKRLFNLSIILVMLLGFLPQTTATAEVLTLWEQLPGGDNAMSSFEGNLQAADDFVLESTSTIGQVEFWSSVPGPVGVNVYFYANSTDGSNMPVGDPLCSASFISTGTPEDSAICPEGNYPYCTNRHTMTLSSPCSLDAGHYWVSLYGVSESHLAWSYDPIESVDNTVKAGYWDVGGVWNSTLRGFAFRLLEPQQTCPESVVVTSDLDSGAGSLRQAIADVCTGGTITFDSTLLGATITLTSQLTLDRNVTIDASALASKVTIDANGTGRVFLVNSGVTATLDSLRIINGNTTAYPYGGGISNSGTLTVLNSSLESNSAQYGAGIMNYGGTLTVLNSNIASNTASSNGGGIYNVNPGVLTVTNTSLLQNTASSGGGIATDDGTTTTVTGSTLAGNQAADTYGSGGGILNGGADMIVVNSTLSANTAVQWGGGIANYGTLTLYNSTLSGNSGHTGGSEGHGLANVEGGILNYANTIIANSPSGYDCVNSYSTIVTNTNNLVEDGSCSAGLSGDPMLDVLGDNGGPTQTMALLTGSPAIDAGDDTICAAAPVNNVDQRGAPRPYGTQCDIGAYEFGAEIPAPNQPPVAFDYYVAYGGWPSETPGWSTFYVPIMDPDGDALTISYISDTDPVTDGVVGDAGYSCYFNECSAIFSILAPTGVEPGGSMWIRFDYKVNDGTSDSNLATVTLSFGEDLPRSIQAKKLASKDGTTTVKLKGDGGAPLTFSTISDPQHGILGDPNAAVCESYSTDLGEQYFCTSEVVYTPTSGFEGEDSFDFVVYDGSAYSEQSRMLLWVAPNSPPTALNGSAVVSTVTTSKIVLEASDPDWIMENPDFWDMHDDLTFIIKGIPGYGSLGTPSDPICEAIDVNPDPNITEFDALCRSNVIYTPNEGTTETTDSFTFYVNDGYDISTDATVSLTLRAPQTLTVNSSNDVVDTGGCDVTHCSLREAVNAAVSGDTIIFAETLSGATITLGGQIQIDKSLTIVGPGADQISISGGEVEHYMDNFNSGGVFYLHGPYGDGGVDPIAVSMSGITIKDGRARYGGAISNESGSTLTLTDCVIGPNNIVTDAGGGIAAEWGSTMILNRCTVVGNHGTGSIGGAGIFADEGSSITLINSTVTDNITNNLGGGILAWYGGTINLVHSTVTGNIANQDYLDYSYGGGGGIYVQTNGIVTLQNSIVAGNTDMTEPTTAYHDKWPDVYGPVTSLGGNLIGDATGSTGWLEGELVGTAGNPIDPDLDVLALNEPGKTPTFALLAGSPAIDAVDCLVEVTVDQRGVERPQPLGGACDIGAFELEQTSVTGTLKISKAFDPLTSGFSGTFAINYICTDGSSGTFNLMAGVSDTIYDIPTGTTCTVTEENLPTAPEGWTFGSPTLSPETGVVTVSEVSPAYAEVIVTNTISRDLGDLVISKDFDPSTSGFSGTFTINYNCNDGHSGTVNLGAGRSETIYEIPTGTTCTVTEPNLPTAPTGWTFGDPSYYPESGIVTITANTISNIGISAVPVGAEVTVTNTISQDPPEVGELKINKVFDPLNSGFTGTFAIDYDCGTAHSSTVNLLADGTTTISGIPTGTQCTVSEPILPSAPEGWSFGEPTFSPSAIVTIGETLVEVTVTNTISQDTPDVGELKITKVFNPGDSGFTDTFAINYDCGTAHSSTVNLSADGTTTISDIPTGTQCTVSEPILPSAPEGWSFGEPTFSPSATVTIGETLVEVTVTNTISQDLGELKITKEFTPGGSGFTDSFAINYDCNDGEAHDGTVYLGAGVSTTISGIPIGTQCIITEPTPTDPTGWSFGAPTYNPADGTVTISDVIAEVTVTNTISQDLGELTSQFTMIDVTCSQFAEGTAPDLSQLAYTVEPRKKKQDLYINEVIPSTFIYYMKMVLPAEESTIWITQENDGGFPSMAASVTLFDENFKALGKKAAKADIDADGLIEIEVKKGEPDRIIYIAITYNTNSVLGMKANDTPNVTYAFSTVLTGGEPIINDSIQLIHQQ